MKKDEEEIDPYYDEVLDEEMDDACSLDFYDDLDFLDEMDLNDSLNNKILKFSEHFSQMDFDDLSFENLSKKINNEENPSIEIESDNIKMSVIIKKDYSILDSEEDIQSELKRDILDIVNYFFESNEFIDLSNFYIKLHGIKKEIKWTEYEPDSH